MKKQFFSVLLACVIMLSFCIGCTRTVISTSPSSVASSSSSVVAVSEPISSENLFELTSTAHVELLLSDEELEKIPSNGIVALGMCNIYSVGDILYYKSLAGTRFEIHKKDMKTGEDIVLFKTDSQYIESFLVVNEDTILINFLMDTPTEQYYFSRYDTFWYNLPSQKLILLNDMFGLDDYCITQVMYDGNSFFVEQFVQNGPEDYTPKFKYSIVTNNEIVAENEATEMESLYTAYDGTLYYAHESSLYALAPEGSPTVILEIFDSESNSRPSLGSICMDNGIFSAIYSGAFFAIDLQTKQLMQHVALDNNATMHRTGKFYDSVQRVSAESANDDSAGSALGITRYALSGEKVLEFPPYGNYKGMSIPMLFCIYDDTLYYLDGNWAGEEPNSDTTLSLFELSAIRF